MITRTFDYWVINNGDKAEAFDTFEDVLAAKMNADWHNDVGTCWVYHYRISPDCEMPKKIDEIRLHDIGVYDLYRYNGKIIIWGNPISSGTIEELKDRCPLLFKEEKV